MSWSVSYTGTKEGAKAALESQFDSAARTLAAKERAFSGIDACDLSQAGQDSQGRKYDGVGVAAYGSRSSCSTQLSVSVQPAVVPAKK